MNSEVADDEEDNEQYKRDVEKHMNEQEQD